MPAFFAVHLSEQLLDRRHGNTERWDHFCNGEHVAYHQRWAAGKLVAHLAGAALIGWAMGASWTG